MAKFYQETLKSEITSLPSSNFFYMSNSFWNLNKNSKF